jgi:hypothetical protein
VTWRIYVGSFGWFDCLGNGTGALFLWSTSVLAVFALQVVHYGVPTYSLLHACITKAYKRISWKEAIKYVRDD